MDNTFIIYDNNINFNVILYKINSCHLTEFQNNTYVITHQSIQSIFNFI